jgi:hypothetical protein
VAITKQEQQALDLFDAGHSIDEVALQMGLARRTVANVRYQLFNPASNAKGEKNIREGSALLLKHIAVVHPHRITVTTPLLNALRERQGGELCHIP